MVKIDRRIPQRGDIFRLSLNPRVGSEQSGYRPVIVISPLAYNKISKIILICPITSRQKQWPFEVKLTDEMETYGVILADQLRAVDVSVRSANFVETAPLEVIDEVLQKIATLVR